MFIAAAMCLITCVWNGNRLRFIRGAYQVGCASQGVQFPVSVEVFVDWPVTHGDFWTVLLVVKAM